MYKLKIDEEFKNLISPLTTDEYNQLEENIKNEGCRDSLVVWNDTIVDGHNRYKICRENNINFGVKEMQFGSREDVKEWIINNQFGRRNLSLQQRSELALELESIYKERAKENKEIAGEKYGRNKKVLSNSTEPIKPIDTRKELAKLAGVSTNTIHKAKVIKEFADDETKQKSRNGEMTVNEAFTRTKLKQEGREDILEKVDKGELKLTEAFNNRKEMKKCNICGDTKPVSEFFKGKSVCKKCFNAKNRLGVTVTAEEEKMIIDGFKDDGSKGIKKYNNKVVAELAELIRSAVNEMNPFIYIDVNLSGEEKEIINNLLKELEETTNQIKNNMELIINEKE